ncbi:hypothetical protein TELCIR_15719 [Teladorsagia circumcincta]|uniref:Uncharacterized protein n=1 Tax=Teladorsagia circumcincta TaxID=45464 RepID=A0A2G9TXS2_TELCI|nr:hypothetical protein TELCIR_15719 [Teladorsagia circumcincta]
MDTVKRNPDIPVDDLQSEFDYQSEVERQKRKRSDLDDKGFSSLEKKPGRDEARAWFQDEHGRVHRQMSRMMAMDAYSRHKELINLYYLSHPGATKMLQRDTSNDRTDYDVLKEKDSSYVEQRNVRPTATCRVGRKEKKASKVFGDESGKEEKPDTKQEGGDKVDVEHAKVTDFVCVKTGDLY